MSSGDHGVYGVSWHFFSLLMHVEVNHWSIRLYSASIWADIWLLFCVMHCWSAVNSCSKVDWLRKSSISWRYCLIALGLSLVMPRVLRVKVMSSLSCRNCSAWMSIYNGRWSPFPSVLNGSIPDAATNGCNGAVINMK